MNLCYAKWKLFARVMLLLKSECAIAFATPSNNFSKNTDYTMAKAWHSFGLIRAGSSPEQHSWAKAQNCHKCTAVAVRSKQSKAAKMVQLKWDLNEFDLWNVAIIMTSDKLVWVMGLTFWGLQSVMQWQCKLSLGLFHTKYLFLEKCCSYPLFWQYFPTSNRNDTTAGITHLAAIVAKVISRQTIRPNSIHCLVRYNWKISAAFGDR